MAAEGLRTVLILLLIGVVCITAQKEENCDRRLDLAFIVDSSGSICEKDPSVEVLPNGRKTCDNWKLVLSFMEKAVDKMEIGANKVRTAMVDFGNKATLVWDFKRYTNDEDVLEGIKSLQYKSQNTNTSGGFRVAYNEVFTRETGDRAGVPNVAILISDGVSTYDKNLTIPTANALKKDKQVTIFGVGVTEAIDEDELKAISSDPQILGQNYFLSANFDELEGILNALVQQTCEVVEPEPEGNKECNRMDLAFLIDRSGSICENDPSRNDRPNGCDNWDRVRNFAVSVIEAFSIGPDFVRVALAAFGNTGELQWNLLGYSDKQSLKSAVEEIPHKYHNTNTSGGLNVLYDEVFTKEGGDRDNVVNVIIVITDGKSTFDQNKTVPTAKKLREDKDAIVFSIGITDQINEQELKEISSPPQVLNSNYFMTASFADLSNILGSIVNRTCEDVQKADSDCPKDLVFVLDYSGSIGPNKYNYVRDFVVTFIKSLDNDTKVGVVLFSDNHRLGFHLNNYTDPIDAAAAVDKIKFQGGRTNTGAAIGYMHEDMYTAANGDREDIDNVVIVITDGRSNTPDRQTVIRESREAKSKGIHMLVLGITKWADEDELIAIASYPASVNVVMVPTVDFLSDFQREVKDLVCNKVNECGTASCNNGGKCEDGIGIAWCICPPGFAGEKCDRVCREPADISLALDSSGSIKRQDFRKEVNFAANIIRKGVNVNGYSRLAVQEFADSSKLHWGLDSFTSEKAMLDAFDFYSTRGKTDTAGALQQMEDEVFVVGDTNGRKKIGVVLSDGRSNSPKDTWQNAMTLRSSGKEMIAVGVGRNTRPKELDSIANDGNVMNLESFDDLDSSLDALSNLLCNNVDDCDPNPCQNGGVCTDKIGGYRCACPADFTGINCERECSGKMDLVFVFDASGSMRRQRFYTAVEMAVNITKQLEVAPDKTRVAAIYFADTTELGFTLDQYSVKQDIIQHLKTQILYKRGRTDTASALDMMMERVLDTSGDRSDVPNICITITCGRSNIRQQETIPKALEAKGKCHMISVGVGSQPAMDELEAMATDPSADMFLTPSWRDMAGKVQGILDATCTKE